MKPARYKFWRVFYYTLISVSYLFIVLINIFLQFNTRIVSGSMVIEKLGYASKKDVFLNELWTENIYWWLKFVLGLMLIFGLLFCIRIYRSVPLLSKRTTDFSQTLRDKTIEFFKEINNTTLLERGAFYVVLIGLIAYRIYCAFQIPLMEDEAFSYVHFVNRGAGTTVSYYPGPNNHILYNLICIPVSWFSNNPVVVMRLPVVLIGIISSIGVFIIVKSHYRYSIAFLAFVLFSFSPNISLYAVIGRGYMLQTLFVMLMLYALMNLMQELHMRFYSYVFVLSGALGMWTVPVHLYAMLPLIVFGLNFGLFMKGINPFWIVRNTFWIIVITTVLYLPIFIFNGVGAVTSNGFIVSEESFFTYMKKIPDYFVKISNWLWDVQSWGGLISLIVFGLSIVVLVFKIRKSRYFWFYMIVSIALMPLIILGIQRVFPYERVWLYFTFFQYLFVALGIVGIVMMFSDKLIVHRTVAATVAIVGISFFIYKNTQNFSNNFKIYEDVKKVTAKVINEKPKKVYVEVSTYDVFLRLEAIKRKVSIEVGNSLQIKEDADVFVLPKESSQDLGKDKKLWFSTPFSQVLK